MTIALGFLPLGLFEDRKLGTYKFAEELGQSYERNISELLPCQNTEGLMT